MNQGGRANHHGLNAPLRIRQVIKLSILVSSVYMFVLTGCAYTDGETVTLRRPRVIRESG
jgi:hypothetical protein